MTIVSNFPRGAEWRRWDLHVHTPESLIGGSFTGVAWEDYVNALESSAKLESIAVIGITDYLTIDGYEKLFAEQRNAAKPRLVETLLLPNIEFRCSPQTKEGHALNIHLLVNVEDPNHIKKIKKSLRNLQVTYKNQKYGCIRDELIQFARAQNADLTNDEAAYKFGIEQFKPSHTEIFQWLNSDGWLSSNSVVGIANGKDGISGLPLDSFAATRDELLCRAHFVFSGNPSDRQHYLGLKDAYPASEIRRQYHSLKPCLHGSDAHSIEKIFHPDLKRYCWIKSDPTFLGLQQAIKEPEARTFIGERPPKLIEVTNNKTYFIDRVEIEKSPSYASGTWLDGCRLSLNPDLVAIIGNKGSGKSALADVIALLGNTKQKEHFSFLKRDRFRGKSDEPAKHFKGSLTWRDGTSETRHLNEDPPADRVDLVRYIPQGHFENLCNEHISGNSSAFERELRTVIFSHTGETIRLGALDFDQLIEQQERTFRDRLSEFRNDLFKINDEISSAERQLQPGIKRALQELLEVKQRQIDEHTKMKPLAIAQPSEELTAEQKETATALEKISTELKAIEKRFATNSADELAVAKKQKAVQTLRERILILERSYKQFLSDTAPELATLSLSVNDVVKFSVTQVKIDALIEAIPEQHEAVKLLLDKDAVERNRLNDELQVLNEKLNAPQLLYQQNLKALEDWRVKSVELTGTPEAPETLKGIEARIQQLEALPKTVDELRVRRLKLSGDIFDILAAQRKGREEFFKPVQDLIQGNSLIRDEYKLQFQATLAGSAVSIATALFNLIKQNSGEFRGEDESFSTIKKLAEECDFNTKVGSIKFISSLHEKIIGAAGGGNPSAVGIVNLLRKDKTASDVYNLLFGLSFLEPRYSIFVQGTQIEQLSPGQRGALLLVFYLLVDTGRTPIILDQPEENLDNETVVSLLVPVLTEAKRRRQIIMVTHNPNLAVVCDAEQVIYSSFDRPNGSKITYVSGAIESPVINKHVIDVLEGTKPAFDNRRVKYH